MTEQDTAWQREHYPGLPDPVLVTGGGGFVGLALVRALRAMGVGVRVLGRHRYPAAEAAGAECVVADVRDAAAVERACQGMAGVFHVAALAGIWGPREAYFSINARGTAHVLAACRRAGVPVLVHTSTPSVVFDRRDIQGGDEGLPLARRPLCHYAASKIEAERLVLDPERGGPAACALRPHLVWGPGDTNLIPRLIERGRAGRLRIVGQGDNLVDIAYIDNVTHAHLLAASNLAGPATAAGRAFFIAQEEPVRLYDWINALFARLDIPPVTRRVPPWLATAMGGLLELAWTLARRPDEPPMTRFLAAQLARSHWFDHGAARQVLGYRALVDTDEGVERLVASLRAEAESRDRPRPRRNFP